MNGHSYSSSGAASCDKGGETRAADFSGYSESELVSLEGNLEHLEDLEDEFEQPDGQRSSLSLDDDDGGTHFEPHSQETVIGRGMPEQDSNASSPTLHEGSDDNDVCFNPAQRLNFDDDDDGEEDDDNKVCLEVGTGNVDNSILGNKECIPHRPGVNGSDSSEHGAYGGMPASAQDQGQNVRIIEGHDSSLLDDSGNSMFGLNFLQAQMIHMPLMSPVNMSSGLGVSNRMEDETHNLYDSLEREDGSSLYGESEDSVMDNSNPEYFGAGSMSLVVAHSQVPDCDSLWAQDDSSDHGSYLPHSQQQFQGGHGTERNFSMHRSPPRNFQVDASSLFVPKRRDGFIGEGNMGGYGDVQNSEEDNTDALTLELSEEGLSHISQMYAQPLSASSISTTSSNLGNSACKGDMGVSHHQSQNDWTSNRQLTHNSNQLGLFDNAANKSVHQGLSNSQPKNLIWSHGSSKDELKAGSHVEGDGIDTKSDERLAGAGSFSTSNQKPTCDVNQSARRPVISKIQTRRPAVQGSASSGDNKRSTVMNSRQGTSVPPRKVIPPAKSGSHSDTIGRVNMAVSRQNSGGEQAKGNSGGVASACSAQSRALQGQTSALSIASRSSSHTSLISNASSTNSRVGGVGKESYMSANPQVSLARGGAALLVVKTESNHPVAMTQRLTASRGDSSGLTLTQTAHVSTGIPQQHQLLHGQLLSSSDRMRPPMGSLPELHKPQSFSKQHSSVHHTQNSITISENVNEPNNMKPGDPHHHNDCQHTNSIGTESTVRNPQSQIQQHHYPQQPLPTEYLACGGQQMSTQSSQTTFPIQTTSSTGASPITSKGNHQISRETVVTQVEAFKKQGPSELTVQRGGHLDNDIQGMEEVRSHLHRMLHMGSETSVTGHEHTDMAMDAPLLEQSLNHQFCLDTTTSSFIGNSHQDDMSDILENFPTFSSKMFSDMPGMSSRSDLANQGENHYLRDSLEKERYRRKHCEEHIQKQNTKLLELQQQLAVAVSTDKRKDLMIEQLDKQLAKVVEGWKKREAEKDELLKVLSQEKEQMEESLQSQQGMVSSLERELSQTCNQLREEKEKSAEIFKSFKAEQYENQREKERLEQALKAEKEEHASMIAEWEVLKESKQLAETKVHQAQSALIQEQEDWMKKEQELSAKISESQEANQRTLNMEKVKFEEQKKKREEAESENEEMKTELKKAIQDIEQLIREKESQKVEMAIMEAKFESVQRKLEADLHSQMEKEIADQAAEFHSRIETSLEDAANRHRRQVGDIQSRHKCDLEKQAATINEERQKKEDDYRRQINELEEKVQELRTENLLLGQSKIKLESQRMEILTKLQYMMQSQWNEAVSLLVTTPQKKSLNSSFLCSQSGGNLGSATAVTGSSTSVTSLGLVTSGQLAARNHAHEGQGPDRSDSSKHPPAASIGVLEDGRDERHEEMDRMDRVEEYLQRLPYNMGIQPMRNDIPVTRNELQASGTKQSRGPGPAVGAVPNNSSGHNYSNAVLQQQQHSSAPGLGSVQDLGGEDFHLKTSNNLGQPSRSSRFHGHVIGPDGKAPTMASGCIGEGNMLRTGPRYQAVAIRSPQQSSSLYSSDTSHHSGTDHPVLPASQHFVFNSQPGQTYIPPHQRHHTRHHHEHKLQASPQQPQSSRVNAISHGSEIRPLTGDFGDHKEVKLMSGSVANINLFRPDSPMYMTSPIRSSDNHWSANAGTAVQHYPTSPARISDNHWSANAGTAVQHYPTSPARISDNHWSPGNSMPVQRYPSVPLMSSAMPLTPGQEAAGRPLYSVESPVKRHRPRTGQKPARHVDELKESLSPPVKQKAERDHSDSTSEVSSGCPDTSRLLASYSQLSDRMEEHQNRQGELQHYVRMLLQKAPGSMCSEPERDLHLSDVEILESSRDLTVDLDLNETATAAELTSQLVRLQHLREQQSTRTAQSRNGRIQQAPSENQSNESLLSQLSEVIDADIISSQRLSQISQLLYMYSDPEMSGQANMAGQLLDALKDAAVSSSSENISRKDEMRSQGAKNSPKSQQARKVKDLSKTRRITSESQSADSSIAVSAYSLESSSKPGGAHGPPRKGSQPTETTKDKKAGPSKQPGGKSSGGPAWK